MDQRLTKIKQCEARIEEVLWSLEVAGDNKGALEAYKAAEAELRALLADAAPSEMAETQRVLAYCLMREGNVLRATGHPDEAGRLSEEEIETARASGDSITLARSLMSHGTNLLVGGDLARGQSLLDEAKALFTSSDSYDHKQGLGWCWILRADLMNAGLLTWDAGAVISAAESALALLLPIENWPGVARAYAARAPRSIGRPSGRPKQRALRSRIRSLPAGGNPRGAARPGQHADEGRDGRLSPHPERVTLAA